MLLAFSRHSQWCQPIYNMAYTDHMCLNEDNQIIGCTDGQRQHPYPSAFGK